MGRLLAGFLVLAGLWGAGKDTVVFDTDSGLFGDDGAALVMLLRSPSQVSVQAITIVPGNVWGRQGAEYMFHILDLLKRANLTVAMGADGPSWHPVDRRVPVRRDSRDCYRPSSPRRCSPVRKGASRPSNVSVCRA